MNKIFISGSIKIKKIHPLVLRRIDNIISANLNILIGDAGGVDSLIQKLLNQKAYKNVTVFYAGYSPRRNIGNWQSVGVKTEYKKNTRQYFTAKDLAMAKECDYGLMIWDSESSGTLKNIYEVTSYNKTSLIFVNKLNKFINVKDIPSFNRLISLMNTDAFLKADKKIGLKKKLKTADIKQLKLFDISKASNISSGQIPVFATA